MSRLIRNGQNILQVLLWALRSQMRLCLLIVGLITALACGATSIVVPFTDGEPILLSKDKLPILFHQCSRQAPDPSAILGVPITAEVDELESGLERYIAEQYEAGKQAPPTATYARQYAAYRVDNQRKIYGNFFPRSLANEARRRGNAVVVCDGGPAFWGIVYDPVSKRFEQLEMNGEA
jgi:hypothetical protein